MFKIFRGVTTSERNNLSFVAQKVFENFRRLDELCKNNPDNPFTTFLWLGEVRRQRATIIDAAGQALKICNKHMLAGTPINAKVADMSLKKLSEANTYLERTIKDFENSIEREND